MPSRFFSTGQQQRLTDYEGPSDSTSNTGVGDDSVDISSGCTDEGNALHCPETNCNSNVNAGIDSCGTET
ncbi:MAG: hypothetical protein GWO07_03060 [Candidatus Dadabacteria bacterium]|nr:hypothetical protein [Candidatus Dadabacteria bacterium]NIS07746.1 hypothetical protein [Candidatus Dadabacteria bacterium]NIV40985.1 hypothetical protein [Candidatus Dadabacteria bacterium]NIX14398.1 hypothetical protein [Candidatus Dadabacteria bacterium]NIY20910.1 hypothetical protein [Candidatus Dadabacteria bacterium]